jgi:tRNA-specific 2-thiouridylase
VPGGSIRDALIERAGWQPRPGVVVATDGSAVGTHGGAVGHTIGQRRGLGVAVGEPRFVSRVDPLTNTITIARREELETSRIALDRPTFVAGRPPGDAFRADVRIRHRGRLVPATVRRTGDPATPSGGSGSWLVETDEPVWAAAPGQALVLFAGDEVLGGGRIAA